MNTWFEMTKILGWYTFIYTLFSHSFVACGFKSTNSRLNGKWTIYLYFNENIFYWAISQQKSCTKLRNTALIISYLHRPEVYVVQTGSWDLGFKPLQPTIETALPTFLKNLYSIYMQMQVSVILFSVQVCDGLIWEMWGFGKIESSLLHKADQLTRGQHMELYLLMQ